MKKYFFIGIGGIGMSGIAKVLLEKGHQVSGSDIASNKQTAELERLGATIYHQHQSSNITDDIDFVVITSAIKNDNPEIIQAKSLHKPILTRSELLNEVITTDHKAIAVTGTHGKTTTSSMLASILEKANLDPTAIIGAEVHTIAGNAKTGKGVYSVAEVCEYQKAFLDIYPFAAVITNIEEDHLDCYKDLAEIVTAFSDFTTHIDKDGFLVVYGEDKNIDAALDFSGEIIRYGSSHLNDVYFQDLNIDHMKTTFSVVYKGNVITGFELQVPGLHNVLNSLATITVALKLGIDAEIIIDVLKSFRGADRRFQVLAEINDIIFVDDYAHHPTEIQATLEGARKFYTGRRVVAIFQPHQHSRTRFLLEDFSKSFENADIVLIPEIYAVRDTDEDKASVSSKDLVEKINKKEQKALFFPDLDQAREYLQNIIKPNDLVITIGAGPVTKVVIDLLNSDFSTTILDK